MTESDLFLFLLIIATRFLMEGFGQFFLFLIFHIFCVVNVLKLLVKPVLERFPFLLDRYWNDAKLNYIPMNISSSLYFFLYSSIEFCDLMRRFLTFGHSFMKIFVPR